jgi:DNA-binding IscR family transcriptional regulator
MIFVELLYVLRMVNLLLRIIQQMNSQQYKCTAMECRTKTHIKRTNRVFVTYVTYISLLDSFGNHRHALNLHKFKLKS